MPRNERRSTCRQVPATAVFGTAIGLLINFAVCTPHDHSYKSPPRARRAQLTTNVVGIPDATVNINSYCGKTWTDAYNSCWLACPTGKDSECADLGPDYECQSFSACHERLQGGRVIPTPPATATVAATEAPTERPTISPTNKPTAEPQTTQTAGTVMIPVCPEGYSQTTQYTLGSMISFPVAGSSVQEVYQCKGQHCNAGPDQAPGTENFHLTWDLVGSCGDSGSSSLSAATIASVGQTQPTAPASSAAAKWYPSVKSAAPECTYGTDYEPKWMAVEILREQFLFETYEECCDAYAELCNPTDSTAINNDPSSATPGTPTASPSMSKRNMAPTVSPTETPTEANSYEDTYSPTSGALLLGREGGSFLIGITTIFMALFL
mmetsp:Transcript_34130/g.82534  ORF Transcript_34130/g.82534 Transcript_34130/m.82534 type:complete len:380 (-) Transcript_34130:329-1468(-)